MCLEQIHKLWIPKHTILVFNYLFFHILNTYSNLIFTLRCWLQTIQSMWIYKRLLQPKCHNNAKTHTHTQSPCLTRTPSMSISANVMWSRSMGTSAGRFCTSFCFISDTGVAICTGNLNALCTSATSYSKQLYIKLLTKHAYWKWHEQFCFTGHKRPILCEPAMPRDTIYLGHDYIGTSIASGSDAIKSLPGTIVSYEKPLATNIKELSW